MSSRNSRCLNVIGVLLVLAFVPLFAAILRIPFAILTPLIVVICAIGAYAVHNSMLDVWYRLLFGVIGYVFKKLDYPIAPLVRALVLGDLAESALRQSLIISQGSLWIFFTRPIASVIRHWRFSFLPSRCSLPTGKTSTSDTSRRSRLDLAATSIGIYRGETGER